MQEPGPSGSIERQETIFNAAVQLRDPTKRACYLVFCGFVAACQVEGFASWSRESSAP